MGPVNFSLSLCATGAPSCSGAANNGSAYGFLDGSDSDMEVAVQVLVAIRLPAGSTPAEQFNGTLAGGTAVAFARSASFEAELQTLEPAPSGERWWGWLSASFQYSRNSPQSMSVGFSASVPQPAGDGPLPSPMHWRPTVGARFTQGSGGDGGRTVDCGETNDQLYGGFNEGGGGQPSVVCVDSPSPDATRGYLEAPITDWGLEGSPAQAPPGSTVTMTFLAKRSGAADAKTTFSLAPSGGAPGGAVTLDRTTVGLGGDSTVPVLATVAIPPGTAPGTYFVTVTGTASGKPARAGTAILTVTAPAPVVTATPTPVVDRRAPVLKLTALRPTLTDARKRGVKATITTDEACAGTLTLKRKSKRVGRVAVTLAKPGKTSLRVKLTKAARKALRRKTTLAFSLTCADAAKNAGSVSRTVRVR
jgi:hypothetical protein